jgi:hypothetical protein
VYSNNPYTQNEKYNICEAITSINELKHPSNNIFKRYRVPLRAKGRHFEHLL